MLFQYKKVNSQILIQCEFFLNMANGVTAQKLMPPQNDKVMEIEYCH